MWKLILHMKNDKRFEFDFLLYLILFLYFLSIGKLAKALSVASQDHDDWMAFLCFFPGTVISLGLIFFTFFNVVTNIPSFENKVYPCKNYKFVPGIIVIIALNFILAFFYYR